MSNVFRDIWGVVKNPVVLMFLFFFGFIQLIVILAALNSNSSVGSNRNSNNRIKSKSLELDWRFKTAIRVDDRANRSVNGVNGNDSASEIILYGSEDYQYPLLVDMPDLVERVKAGQDVSVKPINDPQFKYLIEDKNLCKNSQMFLLILIKSAAENENAREVIRSTWGKQNCWGGRSVQRLFLFGQLQRTNNSSGSQLMQRLQMEQAVHGDVLQADFIDNYYNNTYKIMMGFSWAVSRCKLSAQYVMFVDDDYFIQPRSVVTYLDSLSDALRRRLFSGYVWRMATPQRDHRTKWFVSRQDYPWNFYPPYCSAGNFFVSMNVAEDISIAMRYTKYLRFDDVFLGIVLHKLLVVPMHLAGVFSFNPVTRVTPGYNQLISSHGYKSPKSIMDTWLDLNCSNFCLTLTGTNRYFV